MAFGFAGVHRTGKTTLAKAVADRMCLPFVETNLKDIWKEMGLDASKSYDFATRMKIQYAMLDKVDKAYKQHAVFVTDRTPLCMIGYTLLGFEPGTEVDRSVIHDYIEACFEVSNRSLSQIMVIRPGIEYVQVDNAGNSDELYRLQLEAIINGMTVSSFNKTHTSILGSQVTDLNQRIKIAVTAFDAHRNGHIRGMQGELLSLH